MAGSASIDLGVAPRFIMPAMMLFLRCHTRTRALVALLVTALMLVTGNAVATAGSMAPGPHPPSGAMMMDHSTLTHCHHQASPAAASPSEHSQHALHRPAPKDNRPHCEDGDTCQCLTLCQVSTALLLHLPASQEPPALRFDSATTPKEFPGIHRLPLRPPSRKV